MNEGFVIGDWRVEPARGCLVAASNEALEVRLEPRAMQVLLALAERRAEVVAKEELVEAVWQGAFVGDQVLVNAVWELRRALGDDSKNPRYIQTVPRRGYRLTAEVHEQGAAAARGRGLGLAAAALAVLGVALGAVWMWPRPRVETPPEVRFEIRPESPLGPLYLPALALSDDASKLVFAARGDSGIELRLRRLDRLEEVRVAGSDGGHAPFLSPDGRWLGFFAGGELRKVALEDGGPPVVLAEAGAPRGAAWGTDSWIYFARGSGSGLWRVPAQGGEPESITALAAGEWTHRWPQILPGGETLVFTVGGSDMLSGFDQARIAALSLLSGERRELVRGGSFGRVVAGKLYWLREGRVLAADFDPRRLAIGEPRSVLDGASWYPINGAAQLALSAAGTLAYVPGQGPWQPLRRLRFTSRSGVAPSSEPVAGRGRQPVAGRGKQPAALEPLAEARLYYDPALSGDGRRLAVAIAEAGNSDLWLYDLERRTRSRLTDSPGEDQGPVWHPDGEQIAYYSSQSGPFRMFLADASGSGAPRRLPPSPGSQRPECFTADGRRLIFSNNHEQTGFDLWSLELGGNAEPEPLLVTPYDELHARLSPDGRWLAYVSDESGRREVYLRHLSGDERRWPLSAGGGDEPVWDPGGGALYYRTAGAIHRVGIVAPGDASGEPRIGRPEPWIEWRFPLQLLEGEHRRSFDVDRDGSRFLVLEPLEEAPPPIRVVLNWRPKR